MSLFAAFRRPGLVAIPFLLVLMLAFAGSSAQAQEDSSLSCLGGAHLSEADLAHGTSIVVVWASWSPRSRDIVERVNALTGRWGGRARVVTVNFQEERPVAERFLAGKRLGAPVCLDPDGAFSRKYNVATLPGLLVVKDGQVAYHGKLADDADQTLAGLIH